MTVEAKFKETGTGRVAAMLVAAVVGGGGTTVVSKAIEAKPAETLHVSMADPIIVEIKAEIRSIEGRVRSGEINSATIVTELSAIKGMLTRLEDLIKKDHR